MRIRMMLMLLMLLMIVSCAGSGQHMRYDSLSRDNDLRLTTQASSVERRLVEATYESCYKAAVKRIHTIGYSVGTAEIDVGIINGSKRVDAGLLTAVVAGAKFAIWEIGIFLEKKTGKETWIQVYAKQRYYDKFGYYILTLDINGSKGFDQFYKFVETEAQMMDSGSDPD